MSGVLLQRLIIEATPAMRDQDHIPVVCFTNPQIPDRTMSLAGDDGRQFVAATRATVRTLLRAGATMVAIACNTAHARLPNIQQGFRVPFVNMIDLVATELEQFYPRARVIGVLGTTGTLQSGIYEQALRAIDRRVILPDVSAQEACVRLIYRIKERGVDAAAHSELRQLVVALEVQGATAVILGCTELSLAYQPQASAHLVIDPLRLLAKKLVTEAMNNTGSIV